MSIRLKKFLETTSLQTDKVLSEVLKKSVDPTYHSLVNYQISTGGKRLRPGLAVLCCQIFGGKKSQVIYPAASLEILHNYTLIVDDIIDHSELRRNLPTVWKKYGKSIAECVSMDYAAAIFDLPNKVKYRDKIFPLLASTLKEITSGQFYDILFEQAGREDEPYITKNRYKNISTNKYLKMVGLKTATLLQSACVLGGICANASKQKLKVLGDIGFNLGIAFQIQDDILDIFGDQKRFGKKIGNDIIERKLGNIVLLLSLQELNKTDSKKILKILKGKRVTNEKIKTVMKLIRKTDAKERAVKLEMRYINKVKKSLQLLPQNKYSHLLSDLASFLVNRQK